MLNWFFLLFKNMNPLTKLQEKRICLFLTGNIAHLTHGFALGTLIVASAERMKNLSFGRKVNPNTLYSDNSRSRFPISLILLLSYQQSRVNAIHIVIALTYLTLVCNVLSVLGEVVNFAMVKVDDVGRNEMVAVQFKLFDGKDSRTVVLNSERTINKYVFLDVQRNLYSNVQRDCLLTCRYNLNFKLWYWNL